MNPAQPWPANAQAPKPHWLIRLDRVLISLLWAIPAWLLLLHLEIVTTVPEPEASWAAVMTRATAERWQYGKDIIFTYGPLAPLQFGAYAGKIFTLFFVLELLFKASYIALIAWLSQRLPTARRAIFLLVAIGASALSWQAADLTAIAGIGLVLCEERVTFKLALTMLFFLTALALFKATFLFFSLATLAVVTVSLLLQVRWRYALAPTGLFTLLFCAGWALLGQQISNLPAYLRGSWEITSGYTQAMSIPAAPIVLALSLVTVGLLTFQIVTMAWESRRRWRIACPAATLLFGGLLVAWKQGLVRADDHTTDFQFYAIIAAPLAPAFFGINLRRGPVFYWASVVAICCLGITAIRQQNALLLGRECALLPQRFQQNFYGLFHPREIAVNARAALQQSRDKYALHRIRDIVGNESTDVFGVEQAIVLLNSLHYVPRPSFEGYSTYTDYLIRLNTAFYGSARAPAFVLTQMQPIDNRLPSLEEASLFVALARNYEAVAAERGYILLKHREESGGLLTPSEFLPLGAGEIPATQAINLPSNSAVWCELTMRENLLGEALKFFYQEPPIFIDVTYAKRGIVRRRFIPELGKSGFLINPAPDDDRGFLLFAANESDDPVLSMRLAADASWRRFFEDRITYRLFSVPAAVPEVQQAARNVLESFDRYADVMPSPPKLVKSTTGIARILLDGKPFLLVHAIGEMDFEIPAKSRSISGKFAIRPEAWRDGGKTDGVEFRIDYAPSTGAAPVTIFDRFLNPRAAPEKDGPIQSFQVDLQPGASGQLILRTLPGPANDTSYDWACWGGVQFSQ